MSRYLLGRMAEILVVLLVMSLIVYLMIGLMPGDPIDLLFTGNPDVRPEDVARLRAIYGLDQPLHQRYLAWLAQALQGDFGYSRMFARPAVDVLLPRLGNTVMLMGISFALSIAIALPLGIEAARHPYGALDNGVNLFCFAGISVPPFWLALLLIILFAVVLGWLPASGSGDDAGGGLLGSLTDRARHLVLPVLTLTIASVGHYTRYVRAAMIETLRQDFIRTARAKGVPEAGIVWRHALRNSLSPILTILALSFGSLFSGALITEIMFAWPGMGKTMFDAIQANDYNLALVGLLFATLTTLLGSLLADLAYAWSDPRVRLSERA
ncbi:MAG: ABC transporter permease [Reyranellaceae bacterium]